MFCKKCGHVIKPEELFCTGCGESLPRSKPSASAAQEVDNFSTFGISDIAIRFRAAGAGALVGFTLAFIISLLIPALSYHAAICGITGAAVFGIGAYLWVNSLERKDAPLLDRIEDNLTIMPTGGPAKRVADRLAGKKPKIPKN